MVRWLNVVIEPAFDAIVGLSKVHGIGFERARHLCNAVGLHHRTKIGDIRPWHFEQMTKEVVQRGWLIQDELKKKEYDDIVTLQKMMHYKGIRHALKLPVHGQRTKSNGRSQKSRPRRGIYVEIPNERVKK
mmetsp:Transcript_2598/g.7821  ORF Transcript_2598/g.7821 Transcript_2598/m.7821 type:complete len:131 (+) Transcript_2598:196-588(+)